MTSFKEYSSYPLFDVDDMEDDECLAEFRVKKRDIPALAEALQIPDWISCNNQRSNAEGTEALCFFRMLLKRNRKFLLGPSYPASFLGSSYHVVFEVWKGKLGPCTYVFLLPFAASFLRQTLLHSQLYGRADLHTSFPTLKKVHLNLKSKLPAEYLSKSASILALFCSIFNRLVCFCSSYDIILSYLVKTSIDRVSTEKNMKRRGRKREGAGRLRWLK